jgi:hypothetical protein
LQPDLVDVIVAVYYRPQIGICGETLDGEQGFGIVPPLVTDDEALTAKLRSREEPQIHMLKLCVGVESVFEGTQNPRFDSWCEASYIPVEAYDNGCDEHKPDQYCISQYLSHLLLHVSSTSARDKQT